MTHLCCLNPACYNRQCPDGTKFCLNCGVPLVILRNRYRPIKSLGGGGFSKTYLAEDIDKLNQKCVIKQFAPQVQGTAALQKATELFEQEARRLEQLGEHPQIPSLLAYFQADGRLYLVQQFIDGQDLLQELQQQGNFSEQKMREFLGELLEIIKIVHQQKVIHRDIKPENIIRRRLANSPLNLAGKKTDLVLIDFGASKEVTKTVVSSQGTTIGSFGYVPMEQMQGGEAYQASDLYSLGATCFHLLSGIHPWELWKIQGYGWIGNWRQHLPQPVSDELGQILDKLLQQDYQQRYQSAEQVLQDLNSPQPRVKPRVNIPQIINYEKLALAHTLTGHSDWVRSVAISPDGQTLVSGSDDNTIKIWNLKTKQLKSTLTAHSKWVFSVAISPDGQTLVSGSRDKTIKISNLETGQLKSTLTGHSDWVRSVAISPDGQTLVSGSYDKTIKIWNLETGQLKSTLTGYSDSVFSVTISPDGRTLVSGSGDKTIKIWRIP